MNARQRAARALAYLILGITIPWGGAAAISYVMLHGTPWADTPTAQSPPRIAPLPSPSPTTTTAKPDDSPSPWPLGSCVTSWRPPTPTGCTTDGALQIVGTVQDTDRTRPCADVPETTTVRRAGTHTLCLAAP